MPIRDFPWSAREKNIAREAFNKAHEREISLIRKEVLQRAATLRDAKGVWALHDYLSDKRHEMDQKYDYRYSVLISVFATLVAQGLLTETDLAGLSEDKLAVIAKLSQC